METLAPPPPAPKTTASRSPSAPKAGGAAPTATSSQAVVPVASPAARAVAVSSTEQPSVKTAVDVAAEMAFFKVDAPTGPQPAAAPVARLTEPGSADPATAEPSTPPPAATEEPLIPAYVEPEIEPAAVGDDPAGGSEDVFSLPQWMTSIPAESRPEAEKFARNLHEQKQKLKRQRSEAQAERDAAKKERDEARKAREELAEAPTPVDAPELVLSHLRTRAEVDAFVAKAPAQLEEKEALIENCKSVLAALEKSEGEPVQMFGRTFTASDVDGIQNQGRGAYAELQQIRDGLKNVPKRIEYLDKRGPWQQKAREFYADQYKDDTPLAKVRKELLKEGPSLDAHPRASILIGDHATMEMVRAKKYRLVPVDPKAAARPASHAPATASDHPSAAPTPRPASGASQKDAETAELIRRRNAGDTKAQQEIERRYFSAPSPAAA